MGAVETSDERLREVYISKSYHSLSDVAGEIKIHVGEDDRISDLLLGLVALLACVANTVLAQLRKLTAHRSASVQTASLKFL